ncbi:MAG: hypothetical protein HUU20_25960 [Pirellulales bacterium]|nr:hypothetical protein [Pirellulales bacterium]
MSTLIREPQLGGFDCREEVADDEVRTQVWTVLSSLYPRGNLVERRRENRYPYPYLVHLTPVGPDGVTPHGESVVVVGKHLSDRGLGFYHPKPIPHRRMIASLEISGGKPVAFLIDVNWCRFTRHGWYESGGKFLQAIASPLGTRREP